MPRLLSMIRLLIMRWLLNKLIEQIIYYSSGKKIIGYVHQVIVDDPLYKEYLVNLDSQKRLWEKYPSSYLTNLPTIYKKKMAKEILELNKDILKNSKRSKGFELYGERAISFLSRRSFIEMIPTFHVLREVFKSAKDERAINMKEALQIIKLRDKKYE